MIDEMRNTGGQGFYQENATLEPKGLVERVKGILMSPKTEWAVIAAERPDTGRILTGYVLPLALIPAIGSFLGYGIMGTRHSGIAVSMGIAYALIAYISSVLSVLIGAAVVNALAGTFDSRSDFGRSVQLVAYAGTPSWVAGILNIFPFLSIFVALAAAVYGIYLFYLGMPHVMQTPQQKVVGYMILSAVVLFVAYMVIALILTPIILMIFGLSLMTGAVVS